MDQVAQKWGAQGPQPLPLRGPCVLVLVSILQSVWALQLVLLCFNSAVVALIPAHFLAPPPPPPLRFSSILVHSAQPPQTTREAHLPHLLIAYFLSQQLRGLDLFREFLANTLGIHLLNFWLDAESYRDSTESEPVDTLRMLIVKLIR